MHDVNGKPLVVGDEVLLRAKITHLSEGSETYCNVNIESIHGMPTGCITCKTCGAVFQQAQITAGNHMAAKAGGGDCFGPFEPYVPKQSFSSVNTKMLEKVEK